MKQFRIGIYGLWRGSSFLSILEGFDDAVIAALCDRQEDKLKAAGERCPRAKLFTDYEEMLGEDLDAVFLCNYFHEHAKCAVRAMEKGIAVFSECTSAPTLAECVGLVETAERTGAKYMIAENYPFSAALLEMKRIADTGKLGRILYAEGEYNHTCPKEELAALTPGTLVSICKSDMMACRQVTRPTALVLGILIMIVAGGWMVLTMMAKKRETHS